MEKTKLDNLLQFGITGTPETLPEERLLFLSNLSERIYLTLTNQQVIKKGMYPEVLSLIQSNQDLHLFLNGSLPYHLYSNYIKEAIKHKIPFTIVHDKAETPFGLVLASNTTIEHRAEYDFFIKDDVFEVSV